MKKKNLGPLFIVITLGIWWLLQGWYAGMIIALMLIGAIMYMDNE